MLSVGGRLSGLSCVARSSAPDAPPFRTIAQVYVPCCPVNFQTPNGQSKISCHSFGATSDHDSGNSNLGQAVSYRQLSEVRDSIISYALEDEDEFDYIENGERRLVRPIVALMHVSRRFRAAVLQNSIWRDREFCFSSFLASHPSESLLDNSEIRLTRLCAVLLNDPRFLSYLDGIRRWCFLYLKPLIAVIAYVPSFQHSARAVTLD